MKKTLPPPLTSLFFVLCLNTCAFTQSLTIPFAHNDATVGDTYVQQIREAIRANPDEVWTVDARTSSSGGKTHNLNLSVRRAKAVGDILLHEGVRKDFIHPVYRGETEADQTTDSPDDRVVYLTHRHRRSPMPEKETETEKQPEPSPMSLANELVVVRVIDALTGKTISGEGMVLPAGTPFTFDDWGGAKFEMNYRTQLTARFTAKGYKDTTVTFSTNKQPVVVQLLPDYVAERLVFQNIFFYPNTPDIVPESYRALEMVYRQLSAKRTIAVKIQVRGHVNWPAPYPNTEATMREHQILSEKRAKAVMDWLIKKGIPAETISAVGLGSSQMLFPNATTEGEQAQNRRVEIILMNK